MNLCSLDTMSRAGSGTNAARAVQQHDRGLFAARLRSAKIACERDGRALFSCQKVRSGRICRLKRMHFLPPELRFRRRREK